MLAGLAVPVLLLGVGAAVEYSHLASRRSQLQTAVDAAAIAAAQQLRLSNTTDATIDAVARSVVAQTAPPPDGVTTAVSTELQSKRSAVQVAATEIVKSVIGKALTLPSSAISVAATAEVSGSAKLCLLTLDRTKGKVLYLERNSLVTANGCAIYSNSTDKHGLRADDNARATASLICSAGGIDNKGSLSPAPVTDCPQMADPLASLARPPTGLCTGAEKGLAITASQALDPGTFCGGITVSKGATLTLRPGIYVMNDGPLVVQDTASLIGQNAGIYFNGSAGGMRFDPDTTINLTAPRDGPMAGLLLFEDRSVAAAIVSLPVGPKGVAAPAPLGSAPMREYRISSNNAPNLLGTIYLPSGRIVIDSSRPVADMSAFTVVVAKQLDLNSGPNLFLNSNYGATDIPVPDGVGPKTGPIKLTR